MNISTSERMKLITRNLEECLNLEFIEKKMSHGTPVVYWGTATTGRPHIGYLIPAIKIKDFVNAGCKVKILFADLHAVLDNEKTPLELLEKRIEYYREIISALLLSIGVDLAKIEFVVGSSFQKSERYVFDLYRLCTSTSLHNAKRAGSEVVKQSDSPPLSTLIYPLMQAIDEEYLECDAQFGGIDQRKIFVYASEMLPVLGYRKRAHLMNGLLPSLAGSKMSSSDVNGKIDLLDSEDAVRSKIKKCFCEEGNLECGLLPFLKAVVFNLRESVVLERSEKYGGNLVFSSYEELESAFSEKKVHPGDLKAMVARVLNETLQPIREYFKGKEELVKQAYKK